MKLTLLDTWVFARLLADLPVNGELALVTGPFKGLATHISGLPIEDRSKALAAFFCGPGVDHEAVVAAICAVDPTDPPPESSEQDDRADDDWEPLRLTTLPPVETFPMDVLPMAARDMAEAGARSIGCSVDFLGVGIIAAASGAIGQSVKLLVKPGYFESASVYVALVGSPSTGKSPSIRAATAPLREISEQLYEEWTRGLEAWGKTPEEARANKPGLRRIVTSDPTTEALGTLLANNPRGMTQIPDEMTKWVMSMDQYKGGRGADRPFYLSVWGGEPVIVDRAKHLSEPIMVPHPFLTIVGGMTPGMLGALSEVKGREDGFTARLLFTYPDRVPRPYSEEGIPEHVAEAWRELAMALWRREMRDQDGRPVPHVAKMTPDARREWAQRCQAHRDEQEADGFPESLEGAWGKLESYAARLALVLTCLRHAEDPTLDRAASPTVDPLVVNDAWRLVSYFKTHTRRVRAATGGKAGMGGDDVQALLGWIIRNRLGEFSARDIDRNFDRFKEDQAALADALAWMAGRNLIRPKPEPNDGKAKPDRRRSPHYETNPAVWKSPRFRQFRRTVDSSETSETRCLRRESNDRDGG